MGANRKKVQLSISLLVSNRKDTVYKCLNSLKPLRDAVSCELILVDTGCDEELHQDLLKYADIMTRFTWCDDFSKARNAGLDLANGEWFLYLDDDEWFIDLKEIIDFFQSGNYKKYGYANYIQRNFSDLDGRYYADAWVTRMARLDRKVRFRSRIHEYLDPLKGNVIALHSIVEHYGYVYKNKEEERRHFERNEPLLITMMEEEPENMRWAVQLAQEYASMNYHDKLLAICRKGLKRFANRTEYHERVDIGTFYVGMLYALVGMKKYEEAKDECRKAFADKKNVEMCQAALSLLAAEIAYRLGNWAEIENHVGKYFKLEKKLNKNQPLLFMQSAALLVNESFSEVKHKKAYSLLICAGLKQKNTENLHKYFDLLQWEEKRIYLFEGTVEALTEAMATMPYDELFVKAAGLMRNHGGLWEDFLPEIKRWETKDAPDVQRLMYVISKIEGNDEIIWYARIRTADFENDMEKLPALYENYFVNTGNLFFIPQLFLDIAEKRRMPLAKCLEKVPFDKWKAQLDAYLASIETKKLSSLQAFICGVFPAESSRRQYFEIAMTEYVIRHTTFDSYGSCRDLLHEFSKAAMRFSHRYYKEEVFTSFRELLPPQAQAAYWLEQAFLAEADDRERYGTALKNCAKAYPVFAEAVKALLRLYGEEQIKRQQQAWEAKAEMRRLAAQIKQKVRELMARKMFEEAQQAVSQLKTLCPDDLEVISLGLEARLCQLSG